MASPNKTMSRIMLTEECNRDQILRNPLNDSTSKHSWTFSKDKRFKSDNKICPHAAYDYDLTTLSRRKAGFGYGRRTDFRLNTVYTPSPFNYNMNGTFGRKGDGKSFGVSRDRMETLGYIPPEPKKNPGPGEYIKTTHVASMEADSQRKGYSMRPKTAYDRNYFIEDKQLKDTPGPGRYNDESVVKVAGNIPVSRFRSTMTPNLLCSTSERFPRPNQNPGPGRYFKEEKQRVVNKHSSTVGTMGKSSRVSFTEGVARKSMGPGPGGYKVPSDFGHYKKLKTLF